MGHCRCTVASVFFFLQSGTVGTRLVFFVTWWASIPRSLFGTHISISVVAAAVVADYGCRVKNQPSQRRYKCSQRNYQQCWRRNTLQIKWRCRRWVHYQDCTIDSFACIISSGFIPCLGNVPYYVRRISTHRIFCIDLNVVDLSRGKIKFPLRLSNFSSWHCSMWWPICGLSLPKYYLLKRVIKLS